MYKNDKLIRPYSKTFKLKVLAEINTGKHTKSEIAELYSINPKTLNVWIEKHKCKTLIRTIVLEGADNEKPHIKALQKEIKELKKMLIQKDLNEEINDSYLEIAAKKLGYSNVIELKKNLD